MPRLSIDELLPRFPDFRVALIVGEGLTIPPARSATLNDEIVAAEGTNMPFKDIQTQSPDEIYRFAKKVAAKAKHCDTIYLPCPQWQGAQAVAALEADTGKTVISYTHANFFCAFRKLDIGAPVLGHGKLLASLARI